MARYRVVVTDYDYESLDDEHAVLDPIGAAIVENQAFTEEALIEAIKGADAILCEYAPLTDSVLATLRGSTLRGIVRWGAGLDNIDVAAATKYGVLVCNVPDFGVDDISDHAMTLMFAAVRKLAPMVDQVRAGQWNVSAFKPIFSLKEATLGIVGPGRIGAEVARKAAVFGMRVLGCHPTRPAEFFAERGMTKVSFEELLARSDIVSLSVPLRPETRHMIGERELRLMKPRSVLVNTSRGGVIDSQALARALHAGWIGGAALDVVDGEPPPPDNPLLSAPNCIITPHAAYYSERSYHALKRLAAEEVARLVQGQPPRCPVNMVA